MPTWAAALLVATVLVGCGFALARAGARPWVIVPVWVVLLAAGTWLLGWRAAAGGGAAAVVLLEMVLPDTSSRAGRPDGGAH